MGNWPCSVMALDITYSTASGSETCAKGGSSLDSDGG